MIASVFEAHNTGYVSHASIGTEGEGEEVSGSALQELKCSYSPRAADGTPCVSRAPTERVGRGGREEKSQATFKCQSLCFFTSLHLHAICFVRPSSPASRPACACLHQSSSVGLHTALRSLPRSGRILLIGDHKQLPPTVLGHQARALGRSLFERLFLTVQPLLEARLRRAPPMNVKQSAPRDEEEDVRGWLWRSARARSSDGAYTEMGDSRSSRSGNGGGNAKSDAAIWDTRPPRASEAPPSVAVATLTMQRRMHPLLAEVRGVCCLRGRRGMGEGREAGLDGIASSRRVRRGRGVSAGVGHWHRPLAWGPFIFREEGEETSGDEPSQQPTRLSARKQVRASSSSHTSPLPPLPPLPVPSSLFASDSSPLASGTRAS